MSGISIHSQKRHDEGNRRFGCWNPWLRTTASEDLRITVNMFIHSALLTPSLRSPHGIAWRTNQVESWSAQASLHHHSTQWPKPSNVTCKHQLKACFPSITRVKLGMSMRQCYLMPFTSQLEGCVYEIRTVHNCRSNFNNLERRNVFNLTHAEVREGGGTNE